MASTNDLPDGDFKLRITNGSAEWVNIYEESPLYRRNDTVEPVITATPHPKGKHLVLVTLSQSNSQGYNDTFINPDLDGVDPRIMQWSRGIKNHIYDPGQKNTWIHAQYPLQHPCILPGQAHIGSQISFAKRHLQDNPHDTIYLVNCATGGASFDPFDLGYGEMSLRLSYSGQGKNLFNSMISTVDNARSSLPENNEIMAFLMIQGESEANSGKEQYLQDLFNMIDAARKHMKNEHIPLLVGTMMPSYVAGGLGIKEIDAVHRSIGHSIWMSACADVSKVATGVHTDMCHYNSATQRMAGLVFYDAWLEVRRKYDEAIRQWLESQII
jgi:hypothetical protein